MKNIIFLLFVCNLIQFVNSECCNNAMGRSLFGWSRYSTSIKNQRSEPLCWIYSSLSYVELMYNYKYHIPYELSVEQVSENIYNTFRSTLDYCNTTTGTNGGNYICALKYINQNGIMTKFLYDHLGYKLNMITPVAVVNPTYVCSSHNYTKNYECLKDTLKKTAVLISIHSENNYKISDIVEMTTINHAVLITDICMNSDGEYIEYQNSGGSSWGHCGGFGYVRVTSNNGTVYNNRGVLKMMVVANVFDYRETFTYQNSLKYETIIQILYILCGLAVCVFLLMAFAVVLFLLKNRIYYNI